MRNIIGKHAALTAVVSAVFCVLIYTISLQFIQQLRPFSDYYVENYWVIYLMHIVGCTVTACFFSLAMQAEKKSVKVLLGVLTAVAVMVYCAAFASVNFSIITTCRIIKKLIVSIWPFAVYGIASGLQEARKKRPGNAAQVQYVSLALYYIILVFAMWLIQKLVYSEFYKWEIVETVCLVVVSALAWNLVETGTVCASGRKNLCFAATTVIVLLLFNERFRDVARSLTKPLLPLTGYSPNWVGYRLLLMPNAWQGDFSLMGEPFAANIASSCPLLWTRYALGSAVAVLLFACAALLLYSLLRLVGEMQGGMIQFVGWTLVIRSGIGILADLFVLISTDVGMLLLRNPADVILVCYVVVTAVLKEGKPCRMK